MSGGARPGNTNARTHGHTHRDPGGKQTFSPTYNSWRSMRDRVTRELHPRYPDYGGRGVQIDPRWRGKGGFENFLADMGERPEGCTLDRIDVNGHYTKDNCRWSTLVEQRWNRRDMLERVEDAPPEYRVQALWPVDHHSPTEEEIPF